MYIYIYVCIYIYVYIYICIYIYVYIYICICVYIYICITICIYIYIILYHITLCYVMLYYIILICLLVAIAHRHFRRQAMAAALRTARPLTLIWGTWAAWECGWNPWNSAYMGLSENRVPVIFQWNINGISSFSNHWDASRWRYPAYFHPYDPK